MAYRLRVELDGAERRLPLRPGENLVGSHPDCDVALGHPSISRHHAVLVQGPDRVEVADLGSANGTSVGGRSVRAAVPLEAGAVVSFGTVEAVLERVADDDLVAAGEEPSPGLAADPELGAERGAPPVSPTTASVGPLHLFALGHLPRLARALRRGRSREEMALLVGESLVGSLPAWGVEIEASDLPAPGSVLFTYTGRQPEGGAPATVEVGESVRLAVAFPDEGRARLFRPLVETAWELLMAADGGARPVARERGREPSGDVSALLPEPPFLDPAMRRIYEQAAVVAPGDVNVLVQGESGTGKEVLARYLHRASPRRDGPFVTLNCAALPRDLLEAELFGIERGVATGVAARPGKFEQADGGTLCLDEIGDMASETQARILRVLQEGEVFRVGAQRPRPARVRVVSATNRDLQRLRREGAFRDDLYYRIADWVVTVPPLRERPADIPQLAAWFLQHESRRLGRRVAGLSRAALAALVAYPWPGNVRQLEREISRAVLFVGDGELLESSRLSPEVREHAERAPASLAERLESHERRELAAALDRAGGNVARAAEDLQVPLSTFYRRLKRLGLEHPSEGGGS
jgi:transcriptional regulator with AAA-type ATPase domain